METGTIQCEVCKQQMPPMLAFIFKDNYVCGMCHMRLTYDKDGTPRERPQPPKAYIIREWKPDAKL